MTSFDEDTHGAGYRYENSGPSCAHSYLMPAVTRALASLRVPPPRRRLFDLGCGNGSVAARLSEQGWKVTGVDPSEEGIEHGQRAYPHLELETGSCYDPLAERFGRFPVVLSLEVVEHVYYPRRFAACVFDLLEPNGTAIISTPYHGYLKNLVLSLSGRMDAHFTALWDNGHIKFWSKQTLRMLLLEAGFKQVRFTCVGRVPFLPKSMIAVASK